jgi:ABC-type glycerol-3-phosphate transport system substrate-binding protein
MDSLDERKGLSRRSLLAGIGLGTAGALLAAACGGAAAPVMEEVAKAEEAPKAEEEMKKAEEAPPVQFLHWWIPRIDQNGFTPWALEEFTNRTGIPVEDVGRDPIEPVRQHFRTTIAAGTPVDVSFNSIIWARDHWDLGILMDYTPYLTQYPELQEDKFFEASHQFRQAEGATFGIPVMGPESTSIVVNGQLLLDAGLDENGGDINNWSDLVSVARAMTKKEGNQISVSGFLLGAGVGGLSRWAGWVLTTGTGAYDAEQFKAQYNTEQARDTMQFLHDLWNKEEISAKTPDGGSVPDHYKLLQANQAGMHYDISSTPTLRYFEVPRDFKYWQMGFPSSGGDGGQFATASWMNPVVTPLGAGNPDGAVEFISWFCGLDVGLHKLDVNKAVSPRLDLFASEAWTAGYAELPVLKTREDLANLPGAYPFRRFLKQNAEVRPLLNDAYLGKLDIGTALAEADRLANQILNEPAE